jgi:hypothetical protein
MNEPFEDRLRSYYRSIEADPPARLEAGVTRALDQAPAGRGISASWRPAFGLMAIGAAVIIVALVVRSLGPAPSPTGIVGPSESPTGSPEPSGSLETEPGPTPSGTAEITPTPSPTATPWRVNGTIVPVGAMTPFISGPAVNLNDATVLIVGGMTVRSDGMRLKTNIAEIYSLGTHTFTPTGSMADERYGHTATRLGDGRVLVVGGADLMDGIDNLATAEIYDPYTRQFTRTGSMAQGRAEHTATLLVDGRVLITGGFGGGTLPLSSAEIYDPATGEFTATGSMTVERQYHTATLLPNGKVLIAGGLDAESHVLASAELFDPDTGTFTATASMTTPREWHTATLVPDADNGKVLITGGIGADQATALASAEIYDPATNTFTPTGSMKTARHRHTATELIYGQVIVAGGEGTNSLEVYWPDTGQFGYLQTMLGPSNAAVSLSDRVLFTGDPPELYCSYPASVGPCQ